MFASFFSAFHSILTNKITPHRLPEIQVDYNGIVEKLSIPNRIKDLEVAVDDLGENYDYIIGPRLGRTSSKEQYAYIYRVSTIQPGDSYTYQETSGDAIHREPFTAKFYSKKGNSDFVLITSHVDPDDVEQELAVFPRIVEDAKNHFAGPVKQM